MQHIIKSLSSGGDGISQEELETELTPEKYSKIETELIRAALSSNKDKVVPPPPPPPPPPA